MNAFPSTLAHAQDDFTHDYVRIDGRRRACRWLRASGASPT